MNPNDVVVAVEYDQQNIYLHLADGRVIGNPLEWHAWLARASDDQRANVELYEMSIYFPDLDDGLDVVDMMKGIPPRAEQREKAAQ